MNSISRQEDSGIMSELPELKRDYILRDNIMRCFTTSYSNYECFTVFSCVSSFGGSISLKC